MSSLELWRLGVEDEANRQRLLEAACAVHKREWRESSLPDIGQNPNPVESYTSRPRLPQPQRSTITTTTSTSSTAAAKTAYGSAYDPNAPAQSLPTGHLAGLPTDQPPPEIRDDRRAQRRQLKQKSQRERDSAERRAQLLSLNDTYAVLLNLSTHARFMQSTVVFLSKCISDSTQAAQSTALHNHGRSYCIYYK